MQAQHLSPGRYTDRYEIIRRVGDGGFGVVAEGVDKTNSSHRVAIKTLNEKSGNLPVNRHDACLALLQEVEVLRYIRKLGNVNILRFIGAYLEPLPAGAPVPRIVHITDFCTGGEVCATLYRSFDSLRKPRTRRSSCCLHRQRHGPLHPQGLFLLGCSCLSG